MPFYSEPSCLRKVLHLILRKVVTFWTDVIFCSKADTFWGQCNLESKSHHAFVRKSLLTMPSLKPTLGGIVVQMFITVCIQLQ